MCWDARNLVMPERMLRVYSRSIVHYFDWVSHFPEMTELSDQDRVSWVFPHSNQNHSQCSAPTRHKTLDSLRLASVRATLRQIPHSRHHIRRGLLLPGGQASIRDGPANGGNAGAAHGVGSFGAGGALHGVGHLGGGVRIAAGDVSFHTGLAIWPLA